MCLRKLSEHRERSTGKKTNKGNKLGLTPAKVTNHIYKNMQQDKIHNLASNKKFHKQKGRKIWSTIRRKIN